MERADEIERASERHVRWLRWGALFCALLFEYVAITLGVDAYAVVTARGGWWSLVDFEQLGIALFLCATSVLVLARPSGTSLTRLSVPTERKLVALHVALFGGFWLVTRAMLGSPEAPSGPPLVWLAGWALLGVSATAALGLALLGVPRLRPSGLAAAVLAGLVMAWATSQIGLWTQALWLPFSGAALGLAAGILRALSYDVVVDAPDLLLGLEGFSVRVDAACSGLESMGMLTVLSLTYLAVFRAELRFPRAGLLLVLGLALAWVGNGVRLAAMMWLGARVSPELALGGFHSKAGWVVFSSIALGIAYLGHNSPYFAKLKQPAVETARDLTTAYLMPLITLLAAALVLGMFGQSEGPGYALRMAVGLLTLALFWRQYRELRWTEAGALVPCLLGVGAGLVWMASALWMPAGEARAPEAVSLGWLLVRALGFSMIVPLVEELAFRGYLLRVLQHRNFEQVGFRAWSWWALGISSLVFGALHERWFAATLAGLLYAVIQIRGGRLRDAVLAHATTNATLAVAALASGNSALFS